MYGKIEKKFSFSDFAHFWWRDSPRLENKIGKV